MHLIDYYRQAGFEIARSDNSGSNGPCPECGGKDRLTIFHHAGGSRKSARAPELGSFYCRGCNISGDVIKFMINFCNYNFTEALDELGLDNDYNHQNRRSLRRGKRPLRRQAPTPQKWSPQSEQHADFVEDVGAWRNHAEKFVNLCHETLLQRQSALDWLAARGVGIEQVKRFKIGFNVGQSSKKKGDYQPAYKQASAWGMPNLRRPIDNTRQKTIALNAGLIVPCYQCYNGYGPSGELLRINIRSFVRGWMISKGSLTFLQAQQIINPGHDVAVVVESELDAFALSATLSGVTIIPMGSAGGVPGQAASMELRYKQLILLCLDRDRTGDKDLARWRKNNPGLPDPVYAFGAGVDKAPERWFDNYRQCHPWYCPAPHKDPGEAIEAGCNMDSWFAEGLAYYSVCTPPRKKEVSGATASPTQEQPEDRSKPIPPQIPEWSWLIALMSRRQISIKAIGGVVTLDFTGSVGEFVEGEIDELSRVMQLPQIVWYLGQAKDGCWSADQFR